MKERPILFNAEMVNAVRADRKTQTRRIVKSCPHPNTERVQNFYGETWDWLRYDGLRLGSFTCPYGKIGDQIWVRETFSETDYRTAYRADINDGIHCIVEKWTPSIHMPRWASRIQLEITNVRVERLNDISEQDAKAEGIEVVGGPTSCCPYRNYRIGKVGEMSLHCSAPSRSFMTLWESINGAGSWNENPWVWVVEFKKIENPTSQ